MNTEEDLIKRKDLAQRMHVSLKTIRNYEKVGMPVIHIGNKPRYKYTEVVEWFMSFRSK